MSWGLLALAGCSDSGAEAGVASAARAGAALQTSAPAREPSPAELAASRERLAEYVKLAGPVDPVWTSDVQTAHRQAERAAQSALENGPPALGALALAAFEEHPKDEVDARIGLLSIAARCDPEGTQARLAELVERYESGQDLVRVEAARLLTETAPRAAALLFHRLLTSPPNATLPPAEVLLRYYARAARETGALDVRLLTDVATDLRQVAELRYAAVAELGRTQDPLSVNALKTLLVESGPDGMLRRHAAQSLLELLTPEEACALFTEVADKETEGTFLPFLLDVLNKICP